MTFDIFFHWGLICYYLLSGYYIFCCNGIYSTVLHGHYLLIPAQICVVFIVSRKKCIR